MVLAAGVSSRFSGEGRGLARFLMSEMSTDKGVFTFEGREALLEPTAVLDEVLKNRTPDQTISVLKGAQVGMTTLAIGFAAYCVGGLQIDNVPVDVAGLDLRPYLRQPAVVVLDADLDAGFGGKALQISLVDGVCVRAAPRDHGQ